MGKLVHWGMTEGSQYPPLMDEIHPDFPILGETPPNPVESAHDAVNHPKHYTSDPSGVECIDITKHRNFCIGNAIKYLWRAGLKDSGTMSSFDKQIEDLEKAAFYIYAEIDRLNLTR